MKKINIFIILMSLFLTSNVFATEVGKANIDASTCNSFASPYRSISKSEGSYDYKYCYRISCDLGIYIKEDMIMENGYRCLNGNPAPYTKMLSDGCKGLSGSCNTKKSTYCTSVVRVDCNKTRTGTPYVSNIEPTTKKTTTKKTTTKRTTKKASTTASTTTTSRVLSDNVNINTIKVNGININYHNNQNDYAVSIPYGIKDVEVFVDLEDKSSSYRVVNNKNMPDKDLVIKVVVTSEIGSEKEVNINVKRYTPLSSDCSLNDISIKDLKFKFKPNKTNYKLKIPKNVKSLEFNIIPTVTDKTTFVIEGNNNLKNKSVIRIIAVSEDGNKCVYSIKVKYKSSAWKIILLITLIVGIIGTLTYFLYKFLRKSRGTYKYE